MTSRAAALDGLRYFTAVRPIADRVGVTLPTDAEIARRFAATDDIDIGALTADAAMLRRVVDAVTGATDTAHDVRNALPDAWRGRVADAADAAVAAHLAHTGGAADRIRVVSRTVTAAAGALARVRAEKYRTVSALRTDQVGGVLISTVDVADIDARADAMREDITAAITLFGRTMDTVDDAVSAILTALTDSFTDLPAPAHDGPVQRFSQMSGPQAGVRRAPPTRADVVTAPGAAQTDRFAADLAPLAAAVSATATITGAALAAASVAGMAAAGGLGAMMSHLIDPGDNPHSEVGSGESSAPGMSDAGNEPAGAEAHEDDHRAASEPEEPRGDGDAASDPTRAFDNGAAPAAAPPATAGTPADDRTAGDVAAAGDRAAGDQTGDQPTGVPSRGARVERGRDDVAAGRPDPDDGGGLALAGDR